MVQRCPKSIDVAAGVGMTVVAPILLQGSVQGCTASLDDGDRGVISSHYLNQTKIHQFDHSVRGQLQVARFDIPMEDGRVLAVKEIQGVEYLRCPVEHLAFGEEFLFLTRFYHQRAQVFTRHEIHHQEIAPALIEDI